jgi:hypothetical protein
MRHISRDRRNSPGQPPPPTHVVAHPDQALMTKYYSTVTQTDQAGSGPPTQTNTQAARDTRPQPQHDQPERTERRGPLVASPPTQGQETQDSRTRDDA